MSDRCAGIVVRGWPGSSRAVSGCHRPPLAGKTLCWEHQQEEDYRRRQTERLLARASRHRRGIVWHNQGIECSCGVFVPDGEDHPWDLPWSQEAAES